ncbi:MAG: response regulator [Myxococcales bacterium]|nr:response regulator [Myxococcales bacterium]
MSEQRSRTAVALGALVVDDDDPSRTGVAELLRALAYEVMEAARGDQALALLQAHAVHVVVTDLHLPGASGVQVVRVAKRLHPAVSIALVSGDHEALGELDALQAVQTFPKPLDLDALELWIRQLPAA